MPQSPALAQKKAAIAVASGLSMLDAARKAGVDRGTVTRWMSQPAFRARVNKYQAVIVGRAVAVLTRTMTEAALVIRGTVRGELFSRDRISTAKWAIETGLKLNVDREFERRLSELEEQGEVDGKGKEEGRIQGFSPISPGGDGTQVPSVRP
jgi:hypothetical protein